MIVLNILETHLPFKDPIIIFALILFIILTAPLLLNKLRVPHLIGLIIAGAVIGPNGFHLILRDSSFDLLGTVGLLYIMFLAGLEMDLNDFKKNSKKSLVFGLLTFSFPMILGTLAGYFILGFSFISSVLLASMFATHTLISYPIISKLGIVKNPAVNITVGGTIITDTLALLVLSVISGITTGGLTSNFWIYTIISFTVFICITVFLIPVIGRHFFKHVNDNILQYIFVLTVVFFAALLAMTAGVEGIIGAFFAGLALNRLIPRTSPLMNRIEFVGNALFIPFFLIGVGMLIDFKILLGNATSIWIATVITTLVLLGKYLGAYFTQKLFNYSVDQRNVIFGLSSSHAAATLAIVMIGLNLGLLNEDVLNATILMILVTCTVSSFITQKGAQNIAKADLADAEEDEAPEERFLISVNNPEMVIRLVNLSIILKNSKSKDNLYALNIIRDSDLLEDKEAEKKANKILEIASKTAAATDNRVNELLRYDSDVPNAIINVVREHKITDVVIGLHQQKGISDSFYGTLTEHILSRCNATIFIYKPIQPLATIKRHLVIIPEHADKEIGFPLWLSNVWNIGRNGRAKMIFYTTSETLAYIKLLQEKQPIDADYKVFDKLEEFRLVALDVRPNDNLIIVMSRKNRISYMPAMDRVPQYLDKYIKGNNFMLIYPIQTIDSLDAEIDRLNPSLDYTRINLFRNKVKKLLGSSK